MTEIKKALPIVLLLSVGFSQQEWNMNNLIKKGERFYSKISNKPYSGKVFSLDEHGEIIVEGKYRNGKKDGKWTTRWGNGQKWEEGSYKDSKKYGKWTTWRENGQKQEEGTYKDGKKHGKWTTWYENGQKNFERSYKDGKLISLKCWDENGNEMECEPVQ